MVYNNNQAYQPYNSRKYLQNDVVNIGGLVLGWNYYQSWHGCKYYPKTTLVFNQIEQVERKPFSCHYGMNNNSYIAGVGPSNPKFESQSSGTGILPPSRHRKYPDFEYKLAVAADDAYDIILEVLGDCLLQKSRPEGRLHGEEDFGGEKEQKSGPKENSNGEDIGIKLTDAHIKIITDLLQPYYKKGSRNVIVLSLSGVLRKHGISKGGYFQYGTYARRLWAEVPVTIRI